MCGIFGLSVGSKLELTPRILLSTINDLFKLSESRGKEAAGLAICKQDTIKIYKDSVSATSLIRKKTYKKLFERTLNNSDLTKSGGLGQSITIIGHSRLVTDGVSEIHGNNQPVLTSGLVGIHNGIIVNLEKLWQAFPDLRRYYDVDTEIVLALIRNFYSETNCVIEAVRSTFQLIEGTASIAVLFKDLDIMVLATNNGSLYYCSDQDKNLHIFASEYYILNSLIGRSYIRKIIDGAEIKQLKPGFGSVVNILETKATEFAFVGDSVPRYIISSNKSSKTIVDINPQKEESIVPMPNNDPQTTRQPFLFHRASIDVGAIMALRRCTKCVLPETVPFIKFDKNGVCNYCRNHRPIKVLGKNKLMDVVERYRNMSGKPDCLVTFSGGRDSSFGVHYIKNVLKMNPVTYTYDWGMVTDLARRNIARICGKLGIEHILVSADIIMKRKYIRKNVTAWLKKPDLGTVPLFMAGDKQYFYYANKLRKQMGINFVILCVNPFERTNFKTGFCGVWQPLEVESNYALSMLNQIRLMSYYGKQYLLNPAYINSSIFDTLGAFYSFYKIPHEYMNLYRYIMWNEEEVTSTIIREYDWEVAKDTQTTWRIGDGTASFYNYIYYIMAGFTENDTFRSNQVREGMITREEAITFIEQENQPRYESIKWYCDTIGINFEEAINIINTAPKLYQST